MKLVDLDLNLLVSLEALLREQNISRAATRVGVSQSAMSKTLGRLRTIFADDLLVRVGQEYHLSPFAETVVPELQEILTTLEHTLTRRPSFDPATDQRVFTIAAIDSLEYLIVKPLVQRIMKDAPGVSIEIHAVDGEATLGMMRRGELDLTLTPVEYRWANLSQEILFLDRRVCVVWNGIPDIGERLTEEQLLTMPHAAFNWQGYSTQPERYGEWEFLPQIPVRVTDARLLMRLLMIPGTNLVAFAWEAVAAQIAELADLRVVEPPFEPAVIPQRMLWHPRDTSDPAHKWLREQIAEIASTVVTSAPMPVELEV